MYLSLRRCFLQPALRIHKIGVDKAVYLLHQLDRCESRSPDVFRTVRGSSCSTIGIYRLTELPVPAKFLSQLKIFNSIHTTNITNNITQHRRIDEVSDKSTRLRVPHKCERYPPCPLKRHRRGWGFLYLINKKGGIV